MGSGKSKGTGRGALVQTEGTHVVPGGVVLGARLDAVGQEAEDGPDPQQDGEAPEELAAELDPLRGGGWRRERVRPVPRQDLLGFAVGQTLEAQDSPRTVPGQPWHLSSSRAPAPPRPGPPRTCTQSVLYFRQTSSTDILCSV